MGKQLTNEEFQCRLRSLAIDVYTDDVYKTSKDYMAFYCSKQHKWQAQAGSVLYEHTGCPYCSGRYAIIGETDLWAARPDIARLLKISDDGYKYTAQSNKQALFICPECGTEQSKAINNVYHQGFSCSFCGDGISYPNKFLRSMLSQLSISADYEWQPQWLNPYFYDSHFVINDTHYVVEMDGRLGHGNYTFGNSKDIDGLTTDRIKDTLAAKHNVAVIRINCAYKNTDDRFDFIKKSIVNSELFDLLDLSLVDWDLCNHYGLSSNVMAAANMYLEGYTVGDISIYLKYDRHTIVKWLKIATKIGKCNYDSYESRRRSKSKERGHAINQYDMDGIFVNSYISSRDVERKTGFPSSSICRALKTDSHKYKDFLWFQSDDEAQPDQFKIISNNTKLIKEAI